MQAEAFPQEQLRRDLWVSENNMPWSLHLVVFSSVGLLYLVESTVYRSGVQHDVPISSLVAAGCVPCYEARYGSVSEPQDITSCTGPYLFVGT